MRLEISMTFIFLCRFCLPSALTTPTTTKKQVNLRSVGRKRFAHLSENQDEIHVDANIPWGEDTLFTLEFRADEDGRYALHTCNNRYVNQLSLSLINHLPRVQKDGTD